MLAAGIGEEQLLSFRRNIRTTGYSLLLDWPLQVCYFHCKQVVSNLVRGLGRVMAQASFVLEIQFHACTDL